MVCILCVWWGGGVWVCVCVCVCHIYTMCVPYVCMLILCSKGFFYMPLWSPHMIPSHTSFLYCFHNISSDPSPNIHISPDPRKFTFPLTKIISNSLIDPKKLRTLTSVLLPWSLTRSLEVFYIDILIPRHFCYSPIVQGTLYWTTMLRLPLILSSIKQQLELKNI